MNEAVVVEPPYREALYPGQSAMFEVSIENNSPFLEDAALAYSVRSDDGRRAFSDTMILVSRYTVQPWEYQYIESVGARDADGNRKVGRTFLVALTEPSLTREFDSADGLRFDVFSQCELDMVKPLVCVPGYDSLVYRVMTHYWCTGS